MTATLNDIAAYPNRASLEDLAWLRRESPGLPLGSPMETIAETARSEVLDLIRATREQLLPEAQDMADDSPHEPFYREKVAQLVTMMEWDARRALVLGASLAQVGDASHIDKVGLDAFRQELVAQGLLPPVAAHLA